MSGLWNRDPYNTSTAAIWLPSHETYFMSIWLLQTFSPSKTISVHSVGGRTGRREGGAEHYNTRGGEQARLKRRCPLFACDQASDGVPELLRQGPIHAQQSAPKVSRLTPVTEFSAKQRGGWQKYSLNQKTPWLKRDQVPTQIGSKGVRRLANELTAEVYP